MNTIQTLEEFERIINTEAAVLTYFSHDTCNVCKVLKPKVVNLLATKFALIKTIYCDIRLTPEVAASLSVFTVPTIIIWFEGRETYRFSRNIGLQELEAALQRPYALLFD